MSDGSTRAYRLALPAVFLISFSILVFEIALTRVFSIMLSYHFAFAIVSAAMLGLGAGGLLFKWLRGSARDGAIWTGGFAVSGLFRRFPEGSSLLYGADLIGAAAGALAVRGLSADGLEGHTALLWGVNGAASVQSGPPSEPRSLRHYRGIAAYYAPAAVPSTGCHGIRRNRAPGPDRR